MGEKTRKGYYASQQYEGINPVTGYKYRHYMMIRIESERGSSPPRELCRRNGSDIYSKKKSMDRKEIERMYIEERRNIKKWTDKRSREKELSELNSYKVSVVWKIIKMKNIERVRNIRAFINGMEGK